MRIPRKSRADSRAVLGGGSTDRGGLSFEQTLRLEGGRVTSSATNIFQIYIFGGQKDSPVTPDWPGLRPKEGMFLWVYPGVARLCGCIVARVSSRAARRRGGRVRIGKGRTLAAAS